jgi:competence protein ComEC
MQRPTRIGDVFFGVAAAFLFGTFAANMGWNAWLLGAIGILLSIAIITFSPWHSIWKFAVFFFFAAVAGIFYYHIYISWQTAHTHLPAGKQATFFGVVEDAPKPAGNFMMLAVSLLRPYAGTVDIFTTAGAQFSYGDELWMEGSPDASKDPGEPPAVFLPTLRLVARHQGFWLKEAFINVKDAVTQKIAETFSADEAALLAGIMLGTTGTISAALKAQMEASGTTYIVNMYGYKIAIITAALAAALKDHLPRKALLWITLGAVALFVFASGGTISAVRAAIMGSFAVIARGTGRMFNPRNAVTFAALGMVLVNATLLTDAAFQLSFLSFLGIYYLGPPINNCFGWADGGTLQWKEHAMLSLATNLAILPIVINTFGEFSLTSFISNILIMIPWLAVIAFGALFVLASFVSPALAFCAAQIVGIFLQYELFIIHIFSAITVYMPAVFGSASVIALYYGILIIFAHYYHGAAPQKDH